MTPRLKELYFKEIQPDLKTKLGLKNIYIHLFSGNFESCHQWNVIQSYIYIYKRAGIKSTNIFKFAYQIIVKRGSKGSGFRCIYSDFLKLAQDESKKIYDLKLYSKMSNISDIWKDIGYGLKNLSKN